MEPLKPQQEDQVLWEAQPVKQMREHHPLRDPKGAKAKAKAKAAPKVSTQGICSAVDSGFICVHVRFGDR